MEYRQGLFILENNTFKYNKESKSHQKTPVRELLTVIFILRISWFKFKNDHSWNTILKDVL